jgi:hypothetical protein
VQVESKAHIDRSHMCSTSPRESEGQAHTSTNANAHTSHTTVGASHACGRYCGGSPPSGRSKPHVAGGGVAPSSRCSPGALSVASHSSSCTSLKPLPSLPTGWYVPLALSYDASKLQVRAQAALSVLALLAYARSKAVSVGHSSGRASAHYAPNAPLRLPSPM